MILDIGPRTVVALKSQIATLKTLVWNGPLGAFENSSLRRGHHGVCASGGGGDTFRHSAQHRWRRRHPNIVAVALANKNARIAWSLLTSDSVYDPGLSVRAA